MGLGRVLMALELVALGVAGAAPGVDPGPTKESAPDPAPNPAQGTDSTQAAATTPCVAVMDTVHIRSPTREGAAPPHAAAADSDAVVTDPPVPAPWDLRDPAEEPLFTTYARPVQLMGWWDRLDPDRIRWRYRAREGPR